MKSRFVFFCILFFPSIYLCKGQVGVKGELKLSAGIAKNDFYKKNFLLGLSNAEGLLYTKSQKGISTLDFNLIYFFKFEKWKCQPVLGVAFCPQAFVEKGVMYDTSGNLVDYSIRVKVNYGSIFAGISYPLIETKKMDIRFCQTFNPLMSSKVPLALFRKFGLSTRSSLSADFKLKNKGILSITPFFQTCMAKFNTRKYDPNGPDYFPFSFGLNIGSYFN